MSEPLAIVIEDDPMLGNIATKVMKQLGFETLLDQEGNHYQKWLNPERPPDVILLDVHLPYASGVEILQSLRASEHFAKVPVLIVTADIQRAHALEAQGERVLLKPVSITRLQAVIRELFGNAVEPAE